MSNFNEACRVTGFIQTGETSRWLIENFTVKREDRMFNLGELFRTGRGATPPGEYTRLIRKKPREVVMSDTRDEIRDMAQLFYANPHGRVLVNGLGLGCVIKGLLALPEVTSIDVVEIDPEIIEFIGSQFDDPRLHIHEGDAFTYEWPKGTTWDFAWHDVWDTLSADNLSNEEHARPGTYARLNRRYARRVGKQAAWGQDFLVYQCRRESRSWGYY